MNIKLNMNMQRNRQALWRLISLFPVLFPVVGVVPTAAVAEKSVVETSLLENKHRQSSVDKTQQKKFRAQDYGLSDADMEHYETLMLGPYGQWYRDLDPTWVLGFAAQSESERERYAAIVVQMEHARVERELAFQRTYDRVWRSRTGEHPIIDRDRWDELASVQAMVKEHQEATEKHLKGRRLALFVEYDCTECDLEPVLAAARNKPIDIYVAGTSSDDEIRSWAMTQGISATKVRQRSITLNHAEGLFDSKVDANERMVLFWRTAKGFERWE